MMKHTIVLGAALAALLAFVRPVDAQEQAPPPPRAAVDSARPAVDSARPTLETARPAPDSVRFAPDYVPPASRVAEADLAPATSVAAEAASVLGITVSTSGTARDTLGLLISPVIPGGAGDRGGIDPGNRLAEVNNVNLRIAPADIGRREPAEGAMRALANTLRTVRPGEWVRIRLFGGGRYRTMAIQTPRADTSPVGAPPSSLQRVVDGIGSLRGQLDQLMQAQTVPVPRDTLLRAERELGAIQRRLKAAQLSPRNIDNTVGSLPGLRVAAVAAEMKDYFGEGSEGGLLVLECDITWDPLRNGDVILRVNDEPANLDRLRVALDPQRESRIDFLRRGRYMMVTLHPRE